MPPIKAAVRTPERNWFDGSFSSRTTGKFGPLQVVMLKHYFSGERVKLGVQHLIKTAPMLAPIFQKINVNFDTFIVPEHILWKNTYSFYKGGKRGEYDYPFPNIPAYTLYLYVALDVMMNPANYKGVDDDFRLNISRMNIFNDTLIDDFNLPTFESFIDDFDTEMQRYIDAAQVSDVGWLSGETAPDLTKSGMGDKWEAVAFVCACNMLIQRVYASNRMIYLTTSAQDTLASCILNLPFKPAFYTSGTSGSTVWTNGNSAAAAVTMLEEIRDHLDDWKRCAYLTYILQKLAEFEGTPQQIVPPVSLLPFMGYQSLYREYYRNQFVDDDSSIEEGNETLYNIPYLTDDLDAEDLKSDLDSYASGSYTPSITAAYFLSNSANFVYYFQYTGMYAANGNYYFGNVGAVPYVTGAVVYPDYVAGTQAGSSTIALNGLRNIVARRMKNFAPDYFTSASLDAQLGNPVNIPIDGLMDTSGSGAVSWASGFTVAGTPTDLRTGTTIPDLRNASVLQVLKEKLALVGNRPIEWFRAIFGHKVSDERLQRPTFIKRITSVINIDELTNQTAGVDGAPVGDMYGRGLTVNSNGIMDILVDEPSWVFVVMSIVPSQSYFQGVPIELVKSDRFDFLYPDFASVGMRAIKRNEIFANPSSNTTVFGYTDAYNEYKMNLSEIHSDFRSNMSYWHASRLFGSSPRLNGRFLSIDANKDDLNRIFATVEGDVNHFFCYLNFTLHVERPLPVYPHYYL